MLQFQHRQQASPMVQEPDFDESHFQDTSLGQDLASDTTHGLPIFHSSVKSENGWLPTYDQQREDCCAFSDHPWAWTLPGFDGSFGTNRTDRFSKQSLLPIDHDLHTAQLYQSPFENCVSHTDARNRYPEPPAYSSIQSTWTRQPQGKPFGMSEFLPHQSLLAPIQEEYMNPQYESEEDQYYYDLNSETADDTPYARLIYLALMEAPGHRLVLKDIYRWMAENTNKAKDPAVKGWKNSVRHNLSMNKVSILNYVN